MSTQGRHCGWVGLTVLSFIAAKLLWGSAMSASADDAADATGQSGAHGPTHATRAPVDETALPPAERQRRGLVLATFQGGRITVGDMEDAVASKPPETRARLATPAARQRFLDELIRYDLLTLEAARRGFGRDVVVVEAAMQRAVDAMLAQDIAFDPASVPAADVAREYEAQAQRWNRPLRRRASHIWVDSEKEARALIAQLKAAGRDSPRDGALREAFAKLARERSKDERTRARGGDLGHFDRQGATDASAGGVAVARELAQATFALQRQGSIGPRPVAHGGGFSVVMWTGQTPAVRQSLAQVEGDLREKLATDLQQVRFAELVERLRAQVQPVIHPELVDAIVLEARAPSDIPSGFPAAPSDPRAPPVFVEPDAI
jgi:peptidyl-prolyl cis-trans isomerase C